MSFPHRPTPDQAVLWGAKGRASYARKREQKKIALWRRLARGEALKVAAHNVGISYNTARRYRREA